MLLAFGLMRPHVVGRWGGRREMVRAVGSVVGLNLVLPTFFVVVLRLLLAS